MTFIPIRTIACGVFTLALAAAPAWAHDERGGMEHAPKAPGACTGFVVLLNGYAVLSGIQPGPMGAMGGHEHGHGEMKEDMNMKKMDRSYLMGYAHGQFIRPRAGELCVPYAGMGGEGWKAVSADPALRVTARSLRGALTHSSRDNEGFEIRVARNGKPVQGARVTLRVRMPHHDRTMKGGHGPGNDPDVEGIAAAPGGGGKYLVRTVDFSMAGPWLFEVDVSVGGKSLKAYFAAGVGN